MATSRLLLILLYYLIVPPYKTVTSTASHAKSHKKTRRIASVSHQRASTPPKISSSMKAQRQSINTNSLKLMGRNIYAESSISNSGSITLDVIKHEIIRDLKDTQLPEFDLFKHIEYIIIDKVTNTENEWMIGRYELYPKLFIASQDHIDIMDKYISDTDEHILFIKKNKYHYHSYIHMSRCSECRDIRWIITNVTHWKVFETNPSLSNINQELPKYQLRVILKNGLNIGTETFMEDLHKFQKKIIEQHTYRLLQRLSDYQHQKKKLIRKDKSNFLRLSNDIIRDRIIDVLPRTDIAIMSMVNKRIIGIVDNYYQEWITVIMHWIVKFTASSDLSERIIIINELNRIISSTSKMLQFRIARDPSITKAILFPIYYNFNGTLDKSWQIKGHLLENSTNSDDSARYLPNVFSNLVIDINNFELDDLMSIQFYHTMAYFVTYRCEYYADIAPLMVAKIFGDLLGNRFDHISKDEITEFAVNHNMTANDALIAIADIDKAVFAIIESIFRIDPNYSKKFVHHLFLFNDVYWKYDFMPMRFAVVNETLSIAMLQNDRKNTWKMPTFTDSECLNCQLSKWYDQNLQPLFDKEAKEIEEREILEAYNEYLFEQERKANTRTPTTNPTKRPTARPTEAEAECGCFW